MLCVVVNFCYVLSFFSYIFVMCCRFSYLFVVYLNGLQDFPGYEAHAPTARADVEIFNSRRGDVLAQAVSTATGQLLGSVREELQAVKTQLATQEVTLQHTLIMVQDLCTTLSSSVQQSVNRQVAGNQTLLAEMVNIRNHQETLQMMLHNMNRLNIQDQRINHQRESLVYTGGLDDNAVVNGIDDVETLVANDIVAGAVDNPTVSYATQQVQLAQDLNYGALDLLLGRARAPIVSLDFPNSWEDLYNEWMDNDLESFVKARQKEWDDKPLVQRYSKRYRGIKMIRNRHAIIGNGRLTIAEAIITLDYERARDHPSLSKHMHYLFGIDPTVTRRNRVPRNMINNNNN